METSESVGTCWGRIRNTRSYGPSLVHGQDTVETRSLAGADAQDVSRIPSVEVRTLRGGMWMSSESVMDGMSQGRQRSSLKEFVFH